MLGWVMSEHGVPDSRLTVIGREPNTKNNQARWRCECNCQGGKLVMATGSDLRDGKVKSCGCLKAEKTRERSKKYNRYDLSGEYGIGWTHNTNKEFYFDLEDYDKIKDHCWYEAISDSPYHTLATAISSKNTTIRMHQLILGSNYDHIDRNPLNNRKSNLRPATTIENAQNSSLRSHNKSGVSGVSWYKEGKKWRVCITVNKKQVSLGYYKDKVEAIRARLRAEMKYFGEFAPQQHLYEQYGIIKD